MTVYDVHFPPALCAQTPPPSRAPSSQRSPSSRGGTCAAERSAAGPRARGPAPTRWQRRASSTQVRHEGIFLRLLVVRRGGEEEGDKENMCCRTHLKFIYPFPSNRTINCDETRKEIKNSRVYNCKIPFLTTLEEEYVLVQPKVVERRRGQLTHP